MQIESTETTEFAELMRRLRDGSEEAAWELVERYGSSVQRVIRRSLNEQMRSKFDSIDFVQAVWVSLFKERERFNSFQSPAQLSAFLMGMAKNKLAHEHRRRLSTKKHDLRREQAVGSEDHESHYPSSNAPRPSQIAQARELWNSIIAGESEQNQGIVKLRLAGLTYEEIGSKLGIHERTRTACHRSAFQRDGRMTTRFSVNPTETLPSFDIREQIAHREIFKELLDRSKHGELLEFPKIVKTYPQLREYRSYVLDLVYEDYCQRTAAGEICRTDEYAGVFPEYNTQIHELLEVHRYFQASGSVPAWLTEQYIWPLPGDEFLGFQICSELGRGAIGRVYLAREQKLGNRFVALKVSPFGHAEAQLLAKLNHPHVVPIYSVNEDSESSLTAVCMPYKGRTTLADLLAVAVEAPLAEKSRCFWQELRLRSEDLNHSQNDAPASVLRLPFTETVLDLINQVVRALVYVHEQTILHRDLKPSNILITPDRVAMLLDFNLSTDLSGMENRIGGTLPYMSPEQVEQVLIAPQAKNTLEERADLYSIGVICYELLTGKLPFPAKSAGVVTKSEAIEYVKKIQAGAEPIQRYAPDLDDRTARFVHRCLEFEKTQRPVSASSMLAELEKCRGIQARARRSMLRHPRRVALGMAFFSFLLILAGAFFLTRAPFAERHIELGWRQLADKDYEAAIVSFREVLTVEPKNVPALNGLGRAQFLARDRDGAKETWAESLTIQHDPKIAACLGYLDCRAANFVNALKYFEPIRAELAHSSAFNNNFAHACRVQGSANHAEALELFDAALKINPNLRPALCGRAELAFVTDLNARQPLRSSAIEDIDRAIALPQPYPELLALGSVCHLAKREGESSYQNAKLLALRALSAGLSFKELQSYPLEQKLFMDPEIANNRAKQADPARISEESPWIDPWPSLFQLP
jgi:RNA polymerase sigma factor (sigma-70 family)